MVVYVLLGPLVLEYVPAWVSRNVTKDDYQSQKSSWSSDIPIQKGDFCSFFLLFHSLTLIPTMPRSPLDIHSPLALPAGPLPLPKDKQQIVRPALLRETEHTHTQRPLPGILFPHSLVVHMYCITAIDMCHFVWDAGLCLLHQCPTSPAFQSHFAPSNFSPPLFIIYAYNMHVYTHATDTTSSIPCIYVLL